VSRISDPWTIPAGSDELEMPVSGRFRSLCPASIGLVLSIAVVACLSGCGGIPDSAMQSLEKGDAILQKVTDRAEPLLYDLESLFTDYAYGENTEPFGVAEKMKDCKAEARSLAAMSREAEADFDKALAVKGAGGCTEYVDQAKAALHQVEKIPGVAEAGFKVIDTLGDSDTTAGEKAMETSLYKGTRKLIQINMEMRFAAGYADNLAGNLGLRTRPSAGAAPVSAPSGS
jgi:hypothetical protein